MLLFLGGDFLLLIGPSSIEFIELFELLLISEKVSGDVVPLIKLFLVLTHDSVAGT